MADSLRFGMLGCGMMGQEHILNLQLTGADVAVIAEPDAAMKRKARQLAPNALLVDSLDDLLKSSQLDALLIATPNYQHADQLLRVFESSELPILIEKPLVVSMAQVELIREAAKSYPAPVWVGMEYRFMPVLSRFREQLHAGAIGDLVMLSIREHRYPFLTKVGDWNRFNRNTGGTLVEKCCHFFDLMRLLTADEPVRVMASAGQNCNHLEEEYAGETPDILDNAYVIVDFKSGKRALLDLSMFAQGSRYEQEICAVGKEGKLECLIPGVKAIWGDQQAPTRIVRSPRRPVGPIDTEISVDQEILAAGAHHGSTYYEHLKFRDAVLGNGAVEVGIEDGLKAVVMGMAAQESARTGQAIELSEDGYGFR